MSEHEQPTPAAPPITCPGCGAVYWPPTWPAVHRRTCPHIDTDPATWTPAGQGGEG